MNDIQARLAQVEQNLVQANEVTAGGKLDAVKTAWKAGGNQRAVKKATKSFRKAAHKGGSINARKDYISARDAYRGLGDANTTKDFSRLQRGVAHVSRNRAKYAAGTAAGAGLAYKNNKVKANEVQAGWEKDAKAAKQNPDLLDYGVGGLAMLNPLSGVASYGAGRYLGMNKKQREKQQGVNWKQAAKGQAKLVGGIGGLTGAAAGGVAGSLKHGVPGAVAGTLAGGLGGGLLGAGAGGLSGATSGGLAHGVHKIRSAEELSWYDTLCNVTAAYYLEEISDGDLGNNVTASDYEELNSISAMEFIIAEDEAAFQLAAAGESAIEDVTNAETPDEFAVAVQNNKNVADDHATAAQINAETAVREGSAEAEALAEHHASEAARHNEVANDVISSLYYGEE